jgi:DNA-binding FadR family transcriptional regulator
MPPSESFPPSDPFPARETELAAPVAPPPASKRVFEQVAVDLRARIVDGTLKAGDRLPGERELAEHYQVSRNTVREALRSLENTGLLVMPKRGPGGGAFVASNYGGALRTGMSDLVSLGFVKPADLGEARLVIEVAVARLAAERRTYGDLEALVRNMEQTAVAVKSGDLAEWTRLSFEFHRLLAKATQNPALVVLMDAVIALNDEMVKVAGLRDPKKSAQFRSKILKCLESRDADGAAAEMQQYLDGLRRFYQAKLGI